MCRSVHPARPSVSTSAGHSDLSPAACIAAGDDADVDTLAPTAAPDPVTPAPLPLSEADFFACAAHAEKALPELHARHLYWDNLVKARYHMGTVDWNS